MGVLITASAAECRVAYKESSPNALQKFKDNVMAAGEAVAGNETETELTKLLVSVRKREGKEKV